ncbi:hypothetical protein BDR26DRAFT_867666 [Obelidium mucronatum]|nr:hypothetical protein BDR26DRAFT_867666 [Obelidium mucronatum]
MMATHIRRFASSTTSRTTSTSSPRSALLGFVAGASLVGFAAYASLVSEYRMASSGVLAGVDALANAVARLEAQAATVSALEAAVAALAREKATQAALDDVRAGLLKITDAMQVDHLTLKTQVWELQEDVKRARK